MKNGEEENKGDGWRKKHHDLQLATGPRGEKKGVVP